MEYRTAVGALIPQSDLPPLASNSILGNYTPPPCSFNRVTMNFTVTTQGRQFDRLGIMYLGGVEVFRTSTAEPTSAGIVWTYVKEMEQYNALWNDTQEIVFALPNIVNDVYTGPLATTLTATFFTVSHSPATADQILSIAGNPSGTWGAAFQVPNDGPASVELELPKNVERAVISISACGQQAEEFWYTNVFNDDTDTFPDTVGELYGFSPFREVQLLIDGQLAGVSWPFPIVFTGGIVPGFWRPIVGIDAFDLRQHEIDVTPWLPLLCDGASHTFEIRVVGLNDNKTLSETVGSFWLLTGTVFLFLDKAGSSTTGTMELSTSMPMPQISVSSSTTLDSTGANDTLTYTTNVSRQLSISSTITTSSGTRPVSWTQTLAYSNLNLLTNQGFTQYTVQSTHGSDQALPLTYTNTYYYPMTVNNTFLTTPNITSINGTITHGLDFDVSGPSIFPSGIQGFNLTTPATFSLGGLQTQSKFRPPTNLPTFNGSKLSTTQSGTAEYLSTGKSNTSYSFGTTTQDFDFSGLEVSSGALFELYHRHVMAVNSTITEDEQTLVSQTFAVPVAAPQSNLPAQQSLLLSVKSMLGRGPGLTKAQLSDGVCCGGKD